MKKILIELAELIRSPPNLLQLYESHTNSSLQNLQVFLTNSHDLFLPQIAALNATLDEIQVVLNLLTESENRQQVGNELGELEVEYLWAQIVEMEAQQRAITDLISKLENDISGNQNKLTELGEEISPIQSQYLQKSANEEEEHDKFQQINADLQQLFEEQNQFARKINQLDTDLANPKSKKEPDEIAQLQNEIEELHLKEKELRLNLPEKQRELNAQTLVFNQKKKETRPIKAKLDQLMTESQSLDQIIRVDNERLEEKRGELETLSSQLSSFLQDNEEKLGNRPSTIRTKNLLEQKLNNLQKTKRVISGSEDLPDANKLEQLEATLETQLQEFFSGAEDLQPEIVISEIDSLFLWAQTFRRQFSSHFAEAMNLLELKGGVQCLSLPNEKTVLNFNTDPANVIGVALSFSLATNEQNKVLISTQNLTDYEIELLYQMIDKLKANPSYSQIGVAEEE